MRRAIGIVRVSEVGDRDGDTFASPIIQRERIEAECARDGMKLLRVHEELDVSGGTPLERRKGLRTAIEAVEAGEADVIIGAYFDRLVRSLRVQAELVERVEAAGGQVLALDVGQVTNGSAGQWLSATMLGAVAEYVRRSASERVAGAQRRAVEGGRPPFPLCPGLTRLPDGSVVLDPKPAAVVAEAYRMRADGARIADVRAYLKLNGINRAYSGTANLLSNPLVIGDIRWGAYRGTVPAIVGRETYDRVQRMIIPKGRTAKSDMLLARLGVLRCGSCGARMCVGSQRQQGRIYPLYRCPPNGDCTNRVAINASIPERLLVAAIKEAISDIEGQASIAINVHAADDALTAAKDAFDSALRTFAGFEDETAARLRLVELREARDEAQSRVDDLRRTSATDLTITAADDWDHLSLDGKRALIQVLVSRIVVMPGKGDGRVTVEFIGQ